jgi:hypothetical protein
MDKMKTSLTLPAKIRSGVAVREAFNFFVGAPIRRHIAIAGTVVMRWALVQVDPRNPVCIPLASLDARILKCAEASTIPSDFYCRAIRLAQALGDIRTISEFPEIPKKTLASAISENVAHAFRTWDNDTDRDLLKSLKETIKFAAEAQAHREALASAHLYRITKIPNRTTLNTLNQLNSLLEFIDAHDLENWLKA